MPPPASDYLWQPDAHPWTRDTHLARFMRTRGVVSLAELRQASVHCFQWFWDEALRDIGLEWRPRYTHLRDVSRGLTWTRWFTGGGINVTHNCIDRHVRDGHGADTALVVVAADDGGAPRRVSFATLADLVDRCALALRAAGVQRGDHVAAAGRASLPAVVALFATLKLGARFVPLGPVRPEAWRGCLARCEATVVFAGGAGEGRVQGADTLAILRGIAAELPALTRIVGTEGTEWEGFLQSGGCVVPVRDPFARREKPTLEPEPTHAEEPCLVLFAGDGPEEPVGLVHTHAGCLAQAGRDFFYAFDVRPGEPVFWPEVTNGPMLPWVLIGCLMHRAPVVLDEVLPAPAGAERLWRLSAELGVGTFGASPGLVRGLRAAREEGPGRYDLGRLRLLASAGGGWSEADSLWFATVVGGGRCPVIHTVGGPEMFGGVAQPYPLEPIRAGAVGGPALGIDAAVVTDEGKPAPPGVTGNLVCLQPAPAMTRSYLRDDGRYFATHFERFPGAWDDRRRVRVEADGQWFEER